MSRVSPRYHRVYHAIIYTRIIVIMPQRVLLLFAFVVVPQSRFIVHPPRRRLPRENRARRDARRHARRRDVASAAMLGWWISYAFFDLRRFSKRSRSVSSGLSLKRFNARLLSRVLSPGREIVPDRGTLAKSLKIQREDSIYFISLPSPISNFTFLPDRLT